LRKHLQAFCRNNFSAVGALPRIIPVGTRFVERNVEANVEAPVPTRRADKSGTSRRQEFGDELGLWI
jgi:hypothetical protein